MLFLYAPVCSQNTFRKKSFSIFRFCSKFFSRNRRVRCPSNYMRRSGIEPESSGFFTNALRQYLETTYITIVLPAPVEYKTEKKRGFKGCDLGEECGREDSNPRRRKAARA